MDIYSILMRLIFLTYSLIDDVSADKKKTISTMTEVICLTRYPSQP